MDNNSSGVAVDTSKDAKDSNLDSLQSSTLVFDENKKVGGNFCKPNLGL